jgi:drug/metabolite transporter (DMT)-like permease
MWRAAAMLLPVAAWEIWRQPLHFSKHIIVLQSFTILGGAVGAYVLWNTALEYWPASKVIVFNNLIPLSVMVWARVWLGEPVTSTFWVAMILILSGVMLSQTNWQKLADFAGIE